ALVHGLRHTYATELAGSEVSVYTLMKLLGHKSMTTSQRYVTAAGTETRSAAARNGLYALIPGCATMRTSRYGSTVILSASSGSIPVSRTSVFTSWIAVFEPRFSRCGLSAG